VRKASSAFQSITNNHFHSSDWFFVLTNW
jgi:hypothetical protein